MTNNPIVADGDNQLASSCNAEKEWTNRLQCRPFALPLILSIPPGIPVVLLLVLFFPSLFLCIELLCTGRLYDVIDLLYTWSVHRSEEVLWFFYSLAFIVGFVGMLFQQKWALWLFVIVWTTALWRHHEIVPNLLAKEYRIEKLQIWVPLYLAVNFYEVLLLFSCLRGLWLCYRTKNCPPDRIAIDG